ncbi:MAG: cytochrome c3 family protein [Geminicoccales bacterium]
MQVLLRELQLHRDGSTTYHDREVTSPSISLGSGPDQVIQLLGDDVARHHAVIKGTRIVCRRGLRIGVNGKPVRSASLGPGDRLEVGGHRLEIVTPPGGFDLAIEITRDRDIRSSAFEGAFRTRLDQTVVGKRALSWVLLGAVLLVGLLAPLAKVMHGERMGETLQAWLPGDAFWTTGALLPAHALEIGDDCSACHVELFQRVRDEQCTVCHSDLADHVRETIAPGFETRRCATCHREHNEPPQMVVTADKLCTDCHATPQNLPAGAQLAAVDGFDPESHPAFHVSLLKPADPEAGVVSDWIHEVTSIRNAEEQTNLKFPHEVHLGGTKVRKTSDSSPLVCADCHVLDEDQEHFVPVTMEANCLASGCHDLGFGTADPGRQLPHGRPLDVVSVIEAHFMQQFGDPDAARGSRPRRRLPDRGAAEDVCTSGVYECTMARAENEVAMQFTRIGCVTCHRVEDTGAAELNRRYDVHPVRLVGDYIPSALFDHAAHLILEDKQGDAACLTCHAASTSTESADLLIPDIDNCVECHGDRTVPDKVALGCIECHGYHPTQRLHGAPLESAL